VPSGASTGRHEAVELREGPGGAYDGASVSGAVANVNGPIAQALAGREAADQRTIDETLCRLDGTSDKSRLGGNAILGASLAAADAAAAARGIARVEHMADLWRSLPREQVPGHDAAAPDARLGMTFLLPLPMVNMISGGLHAGGNLDFQDFLVVPVGAAGYRQALQWSVAIYRRLAGILDKAGYESRLVADEGGFGPRLASNEEAVALLMQAIEAAGLRPADDVAIAIDVAGSHFYRDGRYHLRRGSGLDSMLDADAMIELLADWVKRYPIVSLEDGLAEDDWPGWRRLTRRLGSHVQLIGDDLFATNAARLRQGIAAGAANGVLVKLNQAGTLWETLVTTRLALDCGYRPVISARSGETEDVTIADLAVATGAGQIKIGSVARSERLAKYNQLLRLEETLGERAAWLGGRVLPDHGGEAAR
jgi:enolase